MRTVLVALGAGFGVALAKAGAAVFTGSSALAAEASHSLADTANDLFMFVAQRRSTRPPTERHPLGHGREAYFWALIAACGAFFAGAAFSLRDGINELLHPSATSSFAVAYVVLAISTVLDLLSIRQVLRNRPFCSLASARRTVSIASESFCLTWKRSKVTCACSRCSRTPDRYGPDTSWQTSLIRSARPP